MEFYIFILYSFTSCFFLIQIDPRLTYLPSAGKLKLTLLISVQKCKVCSRLAFSWFSSVTEFIALTVNLIDFFFLSEHLQMTNQHNPDLCSTNEDKDQHWRDAKSVDRGHMVSFQNKHVKVSVGAC